MARENRWGKNGAPSPVVAGGCVFAMNSYFKDSHLWEGAGYEFGWGASPAADAKREPETRHGATAISPALIAMVAFLGAAFLIASYYRILVKYCRLWEWGNNFARRLRRIDSREQIFDSDAVLQDSEGWHQIFTNSYGLDEGVIKSIPVRSYRRGDDAFAEATDCAVCLVEFRENEALRILPKCSHGFHVNCVDAWLRSHANCPLCRANVANSGNTPFVPAVAMASSRIRPGLEGGVAMVVHDTFRAAAPEFGSHLNQTHNSEAESIVSSSGTNVDRKLRDAECIEILAGSLPALTRSYSLGSCSVGRGDSRGGGGIDPGSPMDSLLSADVAASSSPRRHRRTSSRWSKVLSPFNPKSSLFSLSSRGFRSPFFRRGSSIFANSPSRRAVADCRRAGAMRLRSGSLSPPLLRVGGPETVESSRRIRAMTSPLFGKRSFSAFAFTPSRLRAGDPEALLSPPRFSRRHS